MSEKQKERVADYEKREAKAVEDGKSSMSEMFSSRRAGKGGLFAELRENDKVYPKHYMVLTNDGGGTKLTLCPWIDRFDTVGQDVVAMNANDFAPFGLAFPDAANIYFAVQSGIETEHMGDIMKGIDDALKLCVHRDAPWTINYGKIETASLDEMLDATQPGMGFDIGMSMTGFMKKADLPSFDPKVGDIIVGLAASGLHSNGYTSARHTLLRPDIEPRARWKGEYRGRLDIDEIIPGTQQSVGEALMTPTAIYLRAMWSIASEVPGVFGVNITGYGLKNFNRTGEGVCYQISEPMMPLPIHYLLMRESGYDVETAWTKSNMGMGFAVIVPGGKDADKVIQLAREEGHDAKIVGYVRQHTESAPITQLYTKEIPDVDTTIKTFRGYD